VLQSTETKEHSDTAHEYNSQDAAENMLNSESSDIDVRKLITILWLQYSTHI